MLGVSSHCVSFFVSMKIRRAVLVCLAGAVVAIAGTTSASGQPPATPIQHVILIDLENHSFDNVLGYWCDANLVRLRRSLEKITEPTRANPLPQP